MNLNTSIGMSLIPAILLALAALSFNAAAEEPSAKSVASKKSSNVHRDDPTQNIQRRLKNLVAQGSVLDAYPIALAQAWIDFARESYFRKDRRASAEALSEAQFVVEAIERDGDQAKVDARLIQSSTKLRDDLWRKAEGFKRDVEFRCATWQTARMEVALIAAGRADRDMGWRAARAFVNRAERFSRDAEAKLKACAEPKPIPEKEQLPVEKKSADDVAAAPPTAGKAIDPTSIQSIPDRVHFRNESAELSDVSALVLEQVSYVLRANPTIVLDLRGYAKDLSTLDENEQLGIARAQAVQDYLVETGVARERLIVRPGSQESGEGKTAIERAKARRVELVPTSSESIPMEYQDKDLAIDGSSGS